MTVMENLEMGGWMYRRKPEILREALEEVFNKYPVLKERMKEKAGNLSGGQQRILEIARLMMSRPKVILMDEPTAQLSPKASKEVYDEIVRLRDEGITVILVDQNVGSALSIADYVYVLKEGSIKEQGDGEIFRKKAKELIKEWFLV
jgi:branched-chain amino acid transport system ATP-binding protein